MDEKNKYYKIVQRTSDNSYIFRSCRTRGKSEVLYRINHWAKTPQHLLGMGYGLLVFDSLENAQNFVHHSWVLDGHTGKYVSDDIIFECEIKNRLKKLPQNMLTLGFLMYGDTHYKFGCGEWPEGSVMAEEVKLIKRIS